MHGGCPDDLGLWRTGTLNVSVAEVRSRDVAGMGSAQGPACFAPIEEMGQSVSTRVDCWKES